MYFTEINALKIDAIRLTINEWSEFLLENERNLLISDLLNATSAVSNIAGTYGSYMKFWKRKSLQNILLEKSPIIPGKANYRVFCRNANEVVSECSVDVVYADPPYTKRQYSAYYHILETISRYDDPQLFGSTGLRRWQDNSSDYCYRRKAPRALQDLISKAQCKYFILSYNNEGQIDHENILSIMKNFGDLTVFETPYRRYKSNSLIQKEVQVIERLYILKMRRENVAI